MPETVPRPWSRLLLAATPAVVFLILGLFLHGNIVSERSERAAATRLRSLEFDLDNVLLDIEDAETGQRGYLLTRDTAYLAPYHAGLARLRGDTANLQSTASDDSAEAARVRALSPFIAAQLQELGTSIDLRSSEGLATATNLVRAGRGKAAMDQIRSAIAGLRADADRDLAGRRAIYEARSRTTYVLLFFGGALSLLIAVLVNLAFVRTEGRLKMYAATVNQQKEDLERAATELEIQLEESQSLQEELEHSSDEIHHAMGIAERAAEDERFLADVSGALAGAPFDVESAMTALVRACVPFLADYAGIDILQSDGSMRRVACAHHDPELQPLLVEMWTKYPFDTSRTGGSPDVLHSGEPVLSPVLELEQIQAFAKSPEHRDMLRRLGPRSYLAVPLRVRDEGAGVLALVMSDSGRVMDERSRDLALAVARRAGLAIDRARLFEASRLASREAQASADRFAFLARASDLLGSSLDYEVTLASVAQLAVPSLADWCAVDILEPDGSAKRLAVAHADPHKTEWPRELDDNALVVPMTTHDHSLGSIKLLMVESQRSFTDQDVRLAEELALRAAVAIDNAQLYRAAAAAADAAAMANRSKSNFLASMSHELRTPLNAIMGYTELMAMGITGSVTTEQEQQLQRIRVAAQHLLELVNDVLDLAKIEAGTLRVEHGTGICGDAVNAAIALVKPQANLKRVRLSEQCEGLPEAVYRGDPHRVRQIVTNLVTNAVKFTPADGRVSATCRAAAADELPPTLDRGRRYVAFVIADTGIGISKQDQSRLFLPFVQLHEQADAPDARERSGTGLGLAISRQLARLMDGDIVVQSELGKGSTFIFFAPSAG